MTIFAASSLNEATLFESADDLEEEHIDILPSELPNPTSTSNIDTGLASQNSTDTNGIPPVTAHVSERNLPIVQKCAWGDEPLLYGSPEISYGIRTEVGDLICVISVSRICVEAGDVLQLWLSFDQSTQGSHCVRATLRQIETRSSDMAILKVRNHCLMC